MLLMFLVSLVVQLVAQQFGGVFGAAIGGIITGVLLRKGGALRVGAASAALATALLLAFTAVRGGDVLAFAKSIGGNFDLPTWGVLLATILLPAIQAGGMAGFVSRVVSGRRFTKPA